MDLARGCVDATCCECWKEGCGPLDGAFGLCADCLEGLNPCLEYFADAIWIFGSPLAFPCIFCFSPDPENAEQRQGPGGGWRLPMMATPCQKPLTCCLALACPWCAQWWARYRALDGDLTKYKLWQGYHDGPQCLARRCPGAPITIESGTYGEQTCPHAFLCAEVCCLGCYYSLCCAHDVTRRYVRDEHGLGKDPTEIRQEKCVGFFGQIMHYCCMCGMCTWCTACLVGCCAPDSSGAQECSGEAGRAARACFSIGRTLWRGIMSTRMIAMGCMVAQQLHELDERQKEGPPAPKKATMER